MVLRGAGQTLTQRAGKEEGANQGTRHWESWLLRGALLAAVVWHVAHGNRQGASVAGEGLVLALLPLLVTRLSGWHVPRLLELTYVLAMVLQFVSESFKLFELFTYWDKIVHPGEIFLFTGLATYLLLGYRDLHRLEMPDIMSAAGALLLGAGVGAFWEFVEFAADWFGNANLQKSNADTMTDLLTNDIGATFGMLLAFWLYVHRTDDKQREEFGRIAEWLSARVAKMFKEHGGAVSVAFAVVCAGVILAGYLVDRGPVPPPPSAPGVPSAWSFTSSGGQVAGTQVLLGDWLPDERGICRENTERPMPGSEKMGLLALEPGRSFGSSGSFSLGTRYFLERPSIQEGSAMAAGLAFGVRDPQSFYLLEVDATHDVVRLDRYLNGKRRDQREKRVRTHGNDWHDLEARVQGDHVTAVLDGQVVFEEPGLEQTDGGIGLWARVSRAGCFSQATVRTEAAEAADGTAPASFPRLTPASGPQALRA